MPKRTSKVPFQSALDRALVKGKEMVGDIEIPKYDPEVVFKVCDAILDGETLSKACAPGNPRGLPSKRTVQRWATLYPEVARSLAAAREMSAYEFEEESIDWMRELKLLPGSAQNVRAADIGIKHLQWVATRRNPRVFSEKSAIKITVPIQINTGLALGEGQSPSEGGVDGNSVYTIEATVVEEAPEETLITATEAAIGEPDAKPLHRPRKRIKEQKP